MSEAASEPGLFPCSFVTVSDWLPEGRKLESGW